MTISVYYDKRRLKKDGTASVQIRLQHGNRTKYIATGVMVTPKQWDARTLKVKSSHPLASTMNAQISKTEIRVQEVAYCHQGDSLDEVHSAAMAALKRAPTKQRDTIGVVFDRVMNLKKGHTREQYENTLKRLRKFASIDTLKFEKVTKGWLMEFDAYLESEGLAPNTRVDYLICLRAVFNFAIDEGITQCYPFRKFSLKKQRTAKRSLSLADLRKLFSVEVLEWQQQYVDFFKLSFFLMGINPIDLLTLPTNAIYDGRIDFARSKTGRQYSMKVEPEAMEIIEQYRGKSYLLAPMDRYKNYSDYRNRANKGLKRIGGDESPLFPTLTLYWARHTWATIAASLDIPKETIGKALGHSEYVTTDIYIDFDYRKVDEANRRVIDWVLYGKK